MTILSCYPYDQKSQNALLQSLSQDSDVQMRLMAMEELARREVGSDTIRQAIGDKNLPENRAVLMPAALSF